MNYRVLLIIYFKFFDRWTVIALKIQALARLKFYLVTTRKDGNAYAVVVTPNIKTDLIFSPALYSL